MGFLVPDDEGPELSFDCFFSDLLAADFTEGSCRREKRSEVALGMFVEEEAGSQSGSDRGRNFTRSDFQTGKQKVIR